MKASASITTNYSRISKFATNTRAPFYEVARAYLPADPSAIIVDIGSGDAGFAKHLGLSERYPNLYLIEGNQETADFLKKSYKNVLVEKAQKHLPFADDSVSLIHCSHMIEHLNPDDLYSLLQEIDRISGSDAVVVISTPMLAPEQFYNDMSHVKPYYPAVLTKYMCGGNWLRTAPAISDQYVVRDLAYRYFRSPIGAFWGGRTFVTHILARCTSKLFNIIGFCEYLKNGYTIILQKK